MKKLLALLLFASPALGDQAVCTPPPPMNSVIVGAQSCTIKDNKPQMSVTITVLEVDTDTTFYRLVLNLGSESKGTLRMVPAGTIPRGTTCDPNQNVKIGDQIYYRFDRTTPGLTWSGNNRPAVVFSLCK